MVIRNSSLNFHKAKWRELNDALIATDWNKILNNEKPDINLRFFKTLIELCEQNVSRKKAFCPKDNKFVKKCKTLMRKRKKLTRKLPENFGDSMSKILNRLKNTDNEIIKSHQKEALSAESIAISKIKSNPGYFYRYAKNLHINPEV